jgi:membrane dipeptidase
VEGASFIEDDLARVKSGYDLGLRHIQLVHYTRNTIGGFQTDSSAQGLTQFGKQIVRECNRLGILVDLAHCTEAAVRDALSVSSAPVAWSHGSVARELLASPSQPIWRRRQISLDLARAIAQKGGVVGLWALAPDIGKNIETFGDRMLELAEWLGEDHVAFGTDINGLGSFGAVSGYSDLRRVVEYWQQQGVGESRIAKLSIGNYARVLKAAFNGGQM